MQSAHFRGHQLCVERVLPMQASEKTKKGKSKQLYIHVISFMYHTYKIKYTIYIIYDYNYTYRYLKCYSTPRSRI